MARNIGFIQRSVDSYIDGFEDEAYRVVTALRLLLHDTKKSKSLLGQLKLQDTPFLSTAKPVDMKNRFPQFPLCILRIKNDGSSDNTLIKFNADGTVNEDWYRSVLASQRSRLSGENRETGTDIRCMPRFNDSPENTFVWVGFEHWWSTTILLEPPRTGRDRGELTRKQLILNMANKDGGAHVDPKLSGTYADITKNSSLAISYGGATTGSIGSPHQASGIQIGYEFLRTILRWHPKLMPDKVTESINSWLPNRLYS